MTELSKPERKEAAERLGQLACDKLTANPGSDFATALSRLYLSGNLKDGVLFKTEFGHPLRFIPGIEADRDDIVIYDPEGRNAISIRKGSLDASILYLSWPKNGEGGVCHADSSEAVEQIEIFLGTNFPRTSRQISSR